MRDVNIRGEGCYTCTLTPWNGALELFQMFAVASDLSSVTFLL